MADDRVVDDDIHVTGNFVAMLNVATFQRYIVADVHARASVSSEEVAVGFNAAAAANAGQIGTDILNDLQAVRSVVVEDVREFSRLHSGTKCG